jgi:preprotein translocase subunit SecF
MGFYKYDVNRYTPRQMVVIPLILLVLALVSVGVTWVQTGLPVKPGIDFSGGTAVTITTTQTDAQIQAAFSGFPLQLPIENGILSNSKYLKFGTMSDAQLQDLSTLLNTMYPGANTIDHIGESFGQNLQSQAILAVIFSFVGMAIVVFLVFRTFVPSAAVVLSAFADIVMTAGVMNVVGLPLSLGTTAALLMLIGYSVDSDILLTMRVLKRQGKLEDKLAGAFHTGIIMTSTALAAVVVMLVVSWIGQITIIRDISAVLLIGLIFDILNTWLTNAGIIKWYVAKSEPSAQVKSKPAKIEKPAEKAVEKPIQAKGKKSSRKERK